MRLVGELAAAFLAGEQSVDGVVARAERALVGSYRWLRPLAARYLKLERPRKRDVERLLMSSRRLRHSLRKLRIVEHLHEPQRMASPWNLPAIETIGDLADWLGLLPTRLDWLADLRGLSRNYFYRRLTKSNGTIRLIEAPKTRLKRIQREILESILDRIPHHPAAHGFVKGRSIQTFAAPHIGQKAVLRLDLQDFFPTFSGARIQTFFRYAGYPESVADLLGGICTNAAPHAIAPNDLYRRPHLPQGSPTSPALANACCYRLDCRLTGFAEACGAVYTRYADDLAFSGNIDFTRFANHAAAIALDEGFSVNFRKTRIMRQGVRQHLAGLVTNQRLNVPRADYDRLKAILTNCVRKGTGDHRRDSLLGQIAFVESVNANRGRKLREIFDRIVWK